MRDFHEAAASLDLRPLAPAPLEQQRGDHRALQQHDPRDGKYGPAVLLPRARRSELHDASGRQACFVDAPAPQLSPVEDGRGRPYRGDLDVAGLLASKDPDGDGGGLSTYISDRKQGAAHEAAAEKTVDVAEHGCIGDRTNSSQSPFLYVRDAGRIHGQKREKDGGAWRKRRGARFHFFERQVVEPGKPDAVREGLKLPAHFLQPEFLQRRIADHHRDVGRLRQQS